VRPGVIVSDYVTGLFNAFSLLIALYHRDAGAGRGERRGQVVDLALYASVLRLLEHTVAAHDRLGVVREREGNRLANSAPLDNWQTKDGEYVSLIAAGDGLFPRLDALIGRSDLLDAERFATLRARVGNADEINRIVEDWCRMKTADEIEALALANDVPFARTLSVAEICADLHVAARGDLTTVEDPVIGPVKMQGVYPRFSRTPGRIRSGAPTLGQHNREVYCGLLGLSEEELAALERDGVV
jgi:crotonobetainyl-CoA:carnitine CoA-transferase CaiB-like acyl-CoA transferase